MRIHEKRRRANSLGVFLALALTVGLSAACLVGVAAGLSGRNPIIGEPAPALNVLESTYYGAYLNLRAEELSQPAGDDSTPVAFNIASGESVASLGQRLQETGLISDPALLHAYLRYTGWDQGIEAGDFILRRTMNVTEIARALTDARAREVMARIFEGWRREQIAESLAQNPTLDVDAAEFLALTGPGAVPVGGSYAFLHVRPGGASLEGYLYPDSYLLQPGATASDLIRRMLENFGLKLTPEMQAAFRARGLTIHEAVTIASLIEREAVHDDERALIASVIFNRLAIGQRLEIDATVQYGLASGGNWWPPLAGLDLRAYPSAYNTYIIDGLPAGPISNVRAASLAAVAEPAQTGYFFYRARCDGSQYHNFAVTYEEHLANACP